VASLIKRGNAYYLQYSVGGKVRRVSTGTDSFQLAREKQRQYESARLRGEDNPLPTRTPLAEILGAYADHVRAVKRPKSAQTDIYYLRHAFGPICLGLRITSRNVTAACLKRPPTNGADRRRRELPIEAPSFEQITTAQISAFLAARVQSRGLAPKTANRYREILVRLFNWAIKQRGVRTAGGKNPAQAVERYRERASEIRFLTLAQIDEQLAALADNPRIRAMVATLIYAGLRREELTWLRRDDVDASVAPYGVIRVRAKTVGAEHWEPKTKVNRVVPISRSLRAVLDAYRPRKSRGDWFFPSPWGARWDVDNFSRELRALNDAAKLPWSCLDFRHTFGSQLAMKGESLFKIATLMGNSQEICRRHYAALLPESLVDSLGDEDPTAIANYPVLRAYAACQRRTSTPTPTPQKSLRRSSATRGSTAS
jgi:integrase